MTLTSLQAGNQRETTVATKSIRKHFLQSDTCQGKDQECQTMEMKAIIQQMDVHAPINKKIIQLDPFLY